jgi:hypothetical protein
VIAALPSFRWRCRGGVLLNRSRLHSALSLRDQFRRGYTEYVRDPEQDNDIRALDAAFHQTDERSVEASGLRELLLRYACIPAALPQRSAECPLRATGRLNLRAILGRLPGRQLNIVWGRLLLKSQI